MFALLLLSTSAYGEIYRWRDSSGVTHYASSMDDVPAKYRSRVKPMNYGPDSKGEPAMTPALPANVAVPPMSPPGPPSAGSGGEAAQNGNLPRGMSRGAKRMRAVSPENE